MRYESLLASRYIKAQKRQSAFTVISIATAVAVMTMVFLLYSVLMDCYRNTSYRVAPYHLAFMELFRRSNKELKQTILIITHDENIAEQCDRIIVLSDGKIISDSGDMARLLCLVAAMVILCMVILGVLVKKIKISQALKLGED